MKFLNLCIMLVAPGWTQIPRVRILFLRDNFFFFSGEKGLFKKRLHEEGQTGQWNKQSFREDITGSIPLGKSGDSVSNP